jgi:undecaprenyl-diphosphatase
MDRRLVVLLFTLLVSGIALSLAAHIFGVFRFDMAIALALRGRDVPGLAAVMTAVSFPGDGWVPVIIVLAASVICASRKKWVEAVFVAAPLSSIVLAGVIKLLVGRPRPPGLSLNPFDVFQFYNQYAYPSGHVLFFVVFFGFVAFLAWKCLEDGLRWFSMSICAILIVLIGPSRIYLGEHWVSDVIGSYIIGAFWLIILILLYLRGLPKETGDNRNP